MKIVIINGSPRKNGATAGIKPFVKRKGESYSGVVTKWKNISIN